MTQHTVMVCSKGARGASGIGKHRKGSQNKRQAWDMKDWVAERLWMVELETVKTPTSGSQQQASVKCKIDMR